MKPDYLALIVVAAIGIGGGLYLLHQARKSAEKWRKKSDETKEVNITVINIFGESDE